MRRRNGGFTLVEVIIVLMVLTIIASIVLPKFTSASSDAEESVLKTNLQLLRRQIEVYKAAHNGRGPELDENGKLDTEHFIDRLTGRTDEDGKLNPNGKLGPYLSDWKPNPYVKEGGDKVTFGTGETSPRNGQTGWYYSTTTGRLSPNSPEGSDDPGGSSPPGRNG
jgi:general secretion pathway protein G